MPIFDPVSQQNIETLASIVTIAVALIAAVAYFSRKYSQRTKNQHNESEQKERPSVLPTGPAAPTIINPLNEDLLKGRNVTLIEDIKEVKKRLKTNSDPLLEGNLSLLEGEAHVNRGERKGLELLQRTIQRVGSTPTVEEGHQLYKEAILGRAHNDIGYYYRSFSNYHAAIQEYLLALPHLQRSHNKVSYAETLRNLAYAYSLQGRLAIAELLCQYSLELSTKFGDQRGSGLTNNTLGLIYTWKGQHHLSQLKCEGALALFDSLKDERNVGLVCTALGYNFRLLANTNAYPLDKAAEYLQYSERSLKRSKDIFSTRVSEPIRLAQAFNELGCTYRDWAKLYRQIEGNRIERERLEKQAQEQLESALDVAGSQQWTVGQLDTLEDLAELKYAEGNDDEAINLLHEAEKPLAEYRILKGAGSPKLSNPITEYWAIFGKTNLLRGHIAFGKRQKRTAAEYYLLANAYLNLYAPSSKLIDYAISAIYKRVQTLTDEELASWYHYLDGFQKEYELENTQLTDIIRDMMGIL